jgi:hypothetical protein
MLALVLAWMTVRAAGADDLVVIDNGTVRVGIDRGKGASITWLSWREYPSNVVNLADPGRLIQQSYYAGKSIDRTADGQSQEWSPWPWNPIQGGGVGSWARVTRFERTTGQVLHSETIPKLWDMPDEAATAVMRQWTSFEPGLSNVIVVRCEFESQRLDDDRWGPPVPRSQEGRRATSREILVASKVISAAVAGVTSPSRPGRLGDRPNRRATAWPVSMRRVRASPSSVRWLRKRGILDRTGRATPAIRRAVPACMWHPWTACGWAVARSMPTVTGWLWARKRRWRNGWTNCCVAMRASAQRFKTRRRFRRPSAG